MTMRVTADGLSLAGRLLPTSLRFEGGTLTCLVGPNGGGKTSLLHALAGVARPAGVVRVDGFDLARCAPRQRERLLAFLPASRDVAWPLPAADLVALGSVSPVARGTIDALFAALELGAIGERRVDTLSTGERSRVLIARALVATPKLLLLDEPTANLDPRWQLKLMAKLRADARANDQAALVAMHDLDLAARYADRLLIVDGGAVVADGDPAALLGGSVIADIFGIEKGATGWRPIDVTPARPQSSR